MFLRASPSLTATPQRAPQAYSDRIDCSQEVKDEGRLMSTDAMTESTRSADNAPPSYSIDTSPSYLKAIVRRAPASPFKPAPYSGQLLKSKKEQWNKLPRLCFIFWVVLLKNRNEGKRTVFALYLRRQNVDLVWRQHNDWKLARMWN
jgi:hypothetical protein